MKMRVKSNFIAIIFMLLGLYVLNKGLSLFKIPESLANIEDIIFAISGILLIFGGFNFMRFGSRKRH
ncbi:MAG TPA: hypothetical protein VJ912_02435 [Candidatus Nanoarchaeia archaeon]|nr:hypothetical protein [Candidatus Nanoarchaeia archaeon]